jgi:hypothetical protein
MDCYMTDQANAQPMSRSLASLAQQLRDGPLHELTKLHRKATRAPDAATASHDERLEQLTELALLSLTAMEQFQAFTRELKAQIAELVGAPCRDLH